VLSVIDKKGRVLGPLSAEEGSTMLAAFALSGASVEARERGADVVRTTQQRDCWFRCDCGSVKNLGRYAASWISGWPNRPSSTAALT